MSRRPCEECRFCERKEQKEEIYVNREERNFIRRIKIKGNSQETEPLIEENTESTNWTLSRSAEEIRIKQGEDVDIKMILDWKNKNIRPKWEEISRFSMTTKIYWAQWDRLEVREGILYRNWIKEGTNEINWQLVLPKHWIQEVMALSHSSLSAGHMGVNRTLARVRAKFYWAKYHDNVRRFVGTCLTCQMAASQKPVHKGQLKQYTVGCPMERVAIDIMGPFPETDQKNKYILCIIDYFTKYAEAFPMPNQEAETVSNIFVYNFISRYGLPLQIHSDQGRQFEGNIFQNTCELLGIHKTRASAYMPQSDGLVERLNRTIQNMLKKIVKEDQKNWDVKLPLVMWAYRSSIQESTGETPNRMMFGRELHLPTDLLFGPCFRNKNIERNESQFVINLEKNLNCIHAHAREKLMESCQRQKKNYDITAHGKEIKEGNKVFLHDPVTRKGLSKKLRNFWTGPFTVVGKLSDLIYRVQKGPRSKVKTVHYNRLKPCLGYSKN